MKSVKIYDKDNRIVFYKNSDLYFIYKYEKGKEVTYAVSSVKHKFFSMFDYSEIMENYELTFSVSSTHLQYEINRITEYGSKEKEVGRVPFDNRKKEWSKKTLTTKTGDVIGVEDFDGNRSVIYKIKEEIINKLTNK